MNNERILYEILYPFIIQMYSYKQEVDNGNTAGCCYIFHIETRNLFLDFNSALTFRKQSCDLRELKLPKQIP